MNSNLEHIRSESDLISFIVLKLDTLLSFRGTDSDLAAIEQKFKDDLFPLRENLFGCLKKQVTDETTQAITNVKAFLRTAESKLTFMTSGNIFGFGKETKKSVMHVQATDLFQKIGELQLAVLNARQIQDNEKSNQDKEAKRLRKEQEKLEEQQRATIREENEKKRAELLTEQMSSFKEALTDTRTQLQEVTVQLQASHLQLQASHQQLAIVSRQYEGACNQLSLVRQEKDEIAHNFKAAIQQISKDQGSNLKEASYIEGEHGIGARLIFEGQQNQSSSSVSHKYFKSLQPNVIPAVATKYEQVTPDSINNVTKLMFHAMSPRRAIAGVMLYRYLMKFQTHLATHHADAYSQDQTNAANNKLDVAAIIWPALLFLFIEIDCKKWSNVLKPMQQIKEICDKYSLTKLSRKIAKIEGKDPEFDPCSFDDTLKIHDEGKTALCYTGKYALSWLKTDPAVNSSEFAKKAAPYCDSMYDRKKKDDPNFIALKEHDRAALTSIYQSK